MDRTMRDLNDLYYFVQVVDHGGFASAARALGTTPRILGYKIKGYQIDPRPYG